MFQIWGIKLPKPILLLLAGEFFLLFLCIILSRGINTDSFFSQLNLSHALPDTLLTTFLLSLMLLPFIRKL